MPGAPRTARPLTGLVALSLVAACSDGEGLDPVDGGPVDAGALVDGGADAGRVDAGSAPDSGFPPRPDAGFADPSIIGQGRETIGRAQLFTTVRGTLTSTMPPLLILPTGPMHGQEYLFEPTEFLLGPGGVTSPDRLMVYLDPRATGRSPSGSVGDAEVTVEAHVRDVENLVAFVSNLVGGTPEVDFLGHGYGAALATLYASRHPERVSRLVLSNPFPADVQDYARWLENTTTRLSSSEKERLNEITDFRVCIRDIELCSEESWRIQGPTWACPENRSVIQSMRFEHLDFRAFGFFINRDLRELEYDWSTDMGMISNIPTTIIWGPCDPIPVSTPMTYTASIAGSRLHTVDGSGHFTLTERPAEFRRIVKRALTY